MSASRFLFALAIVLGLMALAYWRVSPDARVDQVVETRDPSQAPADGGGRHRGKF